jgi:HK97 gp10 family phage protein
LAVKVSCEVRGVREFQAAMDKLNDSLQDEVNKCLVGWAELVKSEAQRLVPVRTGYLQSTIYAKVQAMLAEVGAAATYAVFVEKGTRYMRAKPYLYPAVQGHLPELEGLLIAAIGKAKAEAGF